MQSTLVLQLQWYAVSAVCESAFMDLATLFIYVHTAADILVIIVIMLSLMITYLNIRKHFCMKFFILQRRSIPRPQSSTQRLQILPRRWPVTMETGALPTFALKRLGMPCKMLASHLRWTKTILRLLIHKIQDIGCQE